LNLKSNNDLIWAEKKKMSELKFYIKITTASGVV
jgi:hypothetical protein